VWQTFVVMGGIYFVAMLLGAFGYRLPPPGWPARRTQTASGQPQSLTPTTRAVPVHVAWKARQFWLVWAVLCLNVTAGIGVLGMASPMIQEIFRGRVGASAAAGFAGLLSLFNIGGRIFWASLSDRIGRTLTYALFFGLGMVLYGSVPTAGATGSIALFVAVFGIIISMYGGGFATIPAYLADLFGPWHVSAIHGRLLTAWSTAGVLGPALVNYIREFQIGRGVPPADSYTFTMYVLVALLAIGLACDLAVRPVADALFVAAPASDAVAAPASARATQVTAQAAEGSQRGLLVIVWTLVGLPLGWGIYKTLALAGQLFSR